MFPALHGIVSQARAGAAPPEPLAITYGGQPVTYGGQALAYLAPDPLQLKAGTNVALRLEDDDLFIDAGGGA